MINVLEVMSKKKKLLVFHPAIAPYRVDFFNSLSNYFETRICLFYKFTLFDYSQIESHLKFIPVYLKSGTTLLGKTDCMGIWNNLRDFEPDIVVVSEFSTYSILVLIYKLFLKRNVKVISLCDDNINMVTEHNDFTLLHRLARRVLAPLYDDLILVESKVVNWYQEKFHKGVYFPIIRDDNKARAVYRDLLPRSIKIADKYDLSDKIVFLFVGRLVAIKNVETIISAFSSLNQDSCALVIIGDGDEMASLKSEAGNKRIIFTGRLEGESLYLWYNIADCFVLASYQEPFGAVTNEALLAGCWCIVSENAGSSCLIEEDFNGCTFVPQDVEDLKEKMELFINKRYKYSRNKLRSNLMKDNYHELMNNLIHHINSL